MVKDMSLTGWIRAEMEAREKARQIRTVKSSDIGCISLYPAFFIFTENYAKGTLCIEKNICYHNKLILVEHKGKRQRS